MARKPENEVATARWPQGRQVIWTAIRSLSRSQTRFTLSEIWTATKAEIHRDTIRTYVKSLVLGGILSKSGPEKPGAASHYKLENDPGSEAPRISRNGREVTQGLGTEAMWRTMKIMGSFTAAELALSASTEKAIVTEETAKTYLRYLERAGFVGITLKAVRGNKGGRARYRFVRSRDPGPKPPQIQRIKQVFDPNSNTVVWPKPEQGDGS